MLIQSKIIMGEFPKLTFVSLLIYLEEKWLSTSQTIFPKHYPLNLCVLWLLENFPLQCILPETLKNIAFFYIITLSFLSFFKIFVFMLSILSFISHPIHISKVSAFFPFFHYFSPCVLYHFTKSWFLHLWGGWQCLNFLLHMDWLEREMVLHMRCSEL